MRNRFMGRMLGLTLAFVMGISTPISAFAQSDVEQSEILIASESEEISEEIEEVMEETDEVSEELSDEAEEVALEESSFDAESEFDGEKDEASTEATDAAAEELTDDEEISIEDPSTEETSFEKEEYKVVYHESKAAKAKKKEVIYKVAEAKEGLEKDCFTKTGYEVEQWLTKDGKDGFGSTNIAEVIFIYMDYHKLEVLDLYPEWQPISYFVELNNLEGGIPAVNNNPYDDATNLVLHYGDTLDLSKYIFTRKGYTFKNWTATIGGKTKAFPAKSKIKNLSTKADDVVTLTANWTPNTYKITYKLGGGKQVKAPVSYKTGSNVQLVVPTKTGYSFTGWTVKVNGQELSEEELSEVYDLGGNRLLGEGNEDILSGNVELIANYMDFVYSIVFCDVDGVPFENQPSEFGSEALYQYTSTVNFYNAAREIRVYTGTKLDSYDSIVGFSKKPGGKADYTIDRNYTKLTATEKEIRLYPVVSKKTCYIHYDLEGGKLSKPVYTYKVGQKIVLPTATKPGYKFIGWTGEFFEGEDPFIYKTVKYLDPLYDEYEEAYFVTGLKATAVGDIELTACFEPISYDINILPNGSGVKVHVYGKEDKLVAVNGKRKVGSYSTDGSFNFYNEDFERRGYELLGFSPNAKAKTEEECVDIEEYLHGRKGDINLYCVWKTIEYHVFFDEFANVTYEEDGSVYEDGKQDITEYVSEATVPFGKAYTLPQLDIPGFTFVEWHVCNMDEEYLDSDARIAKKNGKWYQVKADNTVDIAFSASLKDNCYNLRLDPNGGLYNVEYDKAFDLMGKKVSPNADADDIEDAIAIAPEKLTREGYELKGLFLDKNGKKPLPADLRRLPKKVNDTVTVYAVWTKKK